jgi:transcriptional regulator with XRE-family HTH domain
MTNEPRRPSGQEFEVSLIDALEASPRAAQEMAAADLATWIRWALNRALSVSRKSQKDLAESLGVSESAVSQVLSGDGNVKISTLAKYARALGFNAVMKLRNAETGQEITTPHGEKRRRRPGTATVAPYRLTAQGHVVVLHGAGHRPGLEIDHLLGTSGVNIWTSSDALWAKAKQDGLPSGPTFVTAVVSTYWHQALATREAKWHNLWHGVGVSQGAESREPRSGAEEKVSNDR